MAILLLTDDISSSAVQDLLIQTIRTKNAELDDGVRVMTYGVGLGIQCHSNFNIYAYHNDSCTRQLKHVGMQLHNFNCILQLRRIQLCLVVLGLTDETEAALTSIATATVNNVRQSAIVSLKFTYNLLKNIDRWCDKYVWDC